MITVAMTHFGIFPSIQAIADHYDVSYAAALAFSRRHEIPARYDEKTLQAVRQTGQELGYEELIKWHSLHREWRSSGKVGDPPEFPWNTVDQDEAQAS